MVCCLSVFYLFLGVALKGLSELINFYSPWNHQKTRFFVDFKGNGSWYIPLHSLNIRSKIWRRSLANATAQKMKFSIKEFFSKCDQIRRKLWIWSYLLKKSLMENFIFCAVYQIISVNNSFGHLDLISLYNTSSIMISIRACHQTLI